MISDDELLLYYYRDGLDAAERARIGATLSEQPELARRMQALVARLDAASAMPEVPVPEEIQQRWRMALQQESQRDDRRESTRTPRRSLARHRWPMAAAAAAVVVALTVVIQLARTPSTEQTAGVIPPAVAPAAAETSAYERGLKVHLADTERQLAALDGATPDERARLVATIIDQNRMYALAAERAGEPQLARVLRAFSPVLENVARGGDASAGIARLSFELRVMQGRLGADSSSNNQSTDL